ncbi:hypothetical protein CEB3_c09650 [Peptococcaceae bacterium CEB3]|nr:hypothetical protein CEB3_c09650 [Peptococcaceae bacterium CEB3]
MPSGPWIRKTAALQQVAMYSRPKLTLSPHNAAREFLGSAQEHRQQRDAIAVKWYNKDVDERRDGVEG